MLARLLLRPPPRPQLLARTLCRATLPPHAQLHVPRAVRPPRYAVLIDAENVPARLAGPIFEEIQQRVQGVAVDRRVYGDFSLLRNEPWKLASLQYGIETKMFASPTRAKNATDIALCIDAMDIFHDRDSCVDTFVIVSDDGDFTPLANRLRRSGRTVVSVGSGSALIAACDYHVKVNFSLGQKTALSGHTATDAHLIADALLELTEETMQAFKQGDSSGGGGGVVPNIDDGPRWSWIHISALASAVDRAHPGWRRTKMQDFMNFRHMLESPPYAEAFELTSGQPDARSRAAPITLMRLRPAARKATAARRRLAEARQREEGEGATATAGPSGHVGTAVPDGGQRTTWLEWLMGSGGKQNRAVPAAAAPPKQIEATHPKGGASPALEA